MKPARSHYSLNLDHFGDAELGQIGDSRGVVRLQLECFFVAVGRLNGAAQQMEYGAEVRVRPCIVGSQLHGLQVEAQKRDKQNIFFNS